MRKFFLFILLILLLPAAAHAKDFSIPSANVDYTIYDDGRVHVVETITYQLFDCADDSFHELYLQKPADLQITNAAGSCIGHACEFRIDEPQVSVTGDRELILALVNGGCGDVTAVFEYDVKTITKYNDTAQFYYKLWGDKWEKPTRLRVAIMLPGNVEETARYVHYEYFTTNPPVVAESGNTITITADQPAGKFLEINLLMPLSWFKDEGSYYYNNQVRRADIVAVEERTMMELEAKRLINFVLPILFALFALSPVAVAPLLYLIYGRELSPEAAGYIWPYEHDPPSEHGPAECLFFLTMRKDYDNAEISRAMAATMMSLVNKGALDVEERKKNTFLGVESDVVFTFKEPRKELRDYEQSLYDYLKGKAAKNELSMVDFRRTVGPTHGFHEFATEDWRKLVISKIDAGKYADMKGHDTFMGFMAAHAILLFLSLFLSGMCGLFDAEPLAGCFLFAAMFADMLVIGFLIQSVGFLGRWTKEGRVLNLKWSNFKKYLADFTLLEEHPPASVKLWDHYMTYAIALGVAEKTIAAMKKIAPTWVDQSSTARMYASAGAYGALSYGMASTYRPRSSGGSGGGGFGGSGGGGGGGGGGAR